MSGPVPHKLLAKAAANHAQAEELSARHLYESVFVAMEPAKARAKGLSVSYTFRHAVNQRGFSRSLVKAIARKYPVGANSGIQIKGIEAADSPGRLTDIGLYVLPDSGSSRNEQRPIYYHLQSTTYKAMADQLKMKHKAWKAADTADRR
jgi:hypothetical protein